MLQQITQEQINKMTQEELESKLRKLELERERLQKILDEAEIE